MTQPQALPERVHVHPLLARFSGVPALIAQDHQERMLACLAALAAEPQLDAMLTAQAAADDGFWPADDHWMAKYRPYVVVDGVLQIPVKGMLLHDFSFAVGTFATGYVYIWRAFERGLSDPNVKGIALICHSGGGEVAGCFDLVDKMFANKAKPVRAFAHEGAYSAAYAVASVADKIVVSRTGGVGSIGVLTMHVDASKAWSEAGYTVTLIDAPRGGHKTDGSPFKPLADAARARMQGRIDTLYGEFVATVARNRPQLNAATIRATQALTYTAQESIDLKLADAIGSLDDAVAAFAADLSSTKEDPTMTTTAADKPVATFTQADLDRARAEGHTAGKAEGLKLGAEGERARIGAILDHAEAQGREALARHYAFKTDSALDAAVAAMKAAPKSAAKSESDPLASLAAETNVTLGAAPVIPADNVRAAWGKSAARVNRSRGFDK